MAARALRAYRRGEETDDAVLGSMIEAEAFNALRAIVRALAKGGKR